LGEVITSSEFANSVLRGKRSWRQEIVENRLFGYGRGYGGFCKQIEDHPELIVQEIIIAVEKVVLFVSLALLYTPEGSKLFRRGPHG